MFANFTGETATGTGDTLTLTGAMTGHIQFSKSFSDGDPVAYAVVDSGGAIRVAGIGTYNTTGDTITRNDSWNYNGTVVDKDPATNIALSSGTHTVICDTVSNNMTGINSFTPTIFTIDYVALPDNLMSSSTRPLILSGSRTLVLSSAFWASSITFSNLFLEVTVSDAAGLCEIGYYDTDEAGLPKNLLCSSVIDVTTTGRKTVSCGTTTLKAGRYYMACWLNSTIVELWCATSRTHTGIPGAYQYRVDNAGCFQTLPTVDTGLPAVIDTSLSVSDALYGVIVGVIA